MLGSHLSIAGGVSRALLQARDLHMNCVQVFTANQRQWSTPDSIPPDELARWFAALDVLRWRYHPLRSSRKPAPARVVSHNSYLINLASPDSALWEKSISAQLRELLRCHQLQIPLCVLHPGAHLAHAPSSAASRKNRSPAPPPDGKISRHQFAGLKRIIRAINRLHRHTAGINVRMCLETTAGTGTSLGYDFTHLAFIRDHLAAPEQIAFCFDTCHVTAAGYDLSTPAAARHVFHLFDALCGLPNLAVFHLNDSAAHCGSRLDRHAHILHGTCGKSCFAFIMNHPPFASVPKILETPKDAKPPARTSKPRSWDLINMRTLRNLVRRR